MLYGNRLKQIRERIGLTNINMAKIIDVSDSLYSRYEKEIQIIPLKHLNELCDYFDVSLDYIFEFTDKKQYKNNKYKIDKKISGQRLKEFRKENKLTQDTIADILNTTFTTISGYEVGRRIIATPFLYDICNKYKISADYLLGKIDCPKYLK